MNILITGGAGFIGSNLASFYLDRGDSVYVVDNLSTGTIKNILALLHNPAFRFAEADIMMWNDLNDAVNWADRIYHMAAIVGVKKVLEDPRHVLEINIEGTERIFRAVARVRPDTQLIIASSSEVYGFNTNTSYSETDDIVLRSGARLRWCYAVTKLADEFLAYSYMYKSGIQVVIARLFNTIGHHQTGKYGMVVPTFVRQAVRNLPITVYGDGSQTRSFCDVRDTVTALDLLASNPLANGEIVNVGHDQEISILDLANLVVQRAGSSSKVQFLSYVEAYGMEIDEIMRRRPVLDKLHNMTGFQPKWSLVNTIDNLITLERVHDLT
ncbi:MAG: NAD-dependent epimerase/dehydratase family protein [Chlorobiaceae bacterium]|nr:NAD-dependent epimerase/dehydratase family protein [Chlorobiaceae bacterium]